MWRSEVLMECPHTYSMQNSAEYLVRRLERITRASEPRLAGDRTLLWHLRTPRDLERRSISLPRRNAHLREVRLRSVLAVVRARHLSFPGTSQDGSSFLVAERLTKRLRVSEALAHKFKLNPARLAEGGKE